jgi:energy-coupling factor transporter ATP-binding protein EcfA2
MPAPFAFTIPRLGSNTLKVTLEAGQSLFFIGANGAGKTRLAAFIEGALPPSDVHRLAAQKSLVLNDRINLISLERAKKTLHVGHPDIQGSNKTGYRWASHPATHPISDFEALLQTLFAQQYKVATEHLTERKTTPEAPVPRTWLNQLTDIWDELLPHRTLELTDISVRVIPCSTGVTTKYAGSEMSDGERCIFYFIGQCLAAPEAGLIILDEPESHVHRAILGPLWDAIEKARPDCAFIYITHDVDFAAARTASVKYFLRSYEHGSPGKWDIEVLPDDAELPGAVIAELVGSRKPILFVEGTRGSLDLTIYRSHYAGFTIIPVGSCSAVIGSVASYQESNILHWLEVRGLIDADHRSADEIENLKSLGVHVLPVAEVENLLLLPGVFMALADALACDDVSGRLSKLQAEVMSEAQANLDQVSVGYTSRKLDRQLKLVAATAKDLPTLLAHYKTNLASINPESIFIEFKDALSSKIKSGDLPGVLQLYDNKGLAAKAAAKLGLANRSQLFEKTGRLLGGDNGEKLREELAKVLPVFV